MTNHVSPSAARAPRDPDETADRDRDRTRRKLQAERDLAELEALLTKQLKGSPSIAAGDMNAEPLYRNRQPAWPRAAAPRREPELSARRTQREPEHSFSPALDRLEDLPPIAAMRADKRSPIARAMSFAATLFSLLALVAVSALLVMLAVGSEPTAHVEGTAARAGEPAIAAEIAPDASLPAEPVGPAVVTGSIEAKRDTSRIPSEEHAPRAFGTVRAVDAQPASNQTPQAVDPSPADNTPAAPASIASEPASGAFAQSTFAPPAEEPASPARAFAAEPAAASAAPAPETRSAPVTTHVNLRASPDNDAAVVTVVPKGRNVEVVDCTQWCEVVYDGRQGFIHKRFVTGAGG